MDTYCDIVMIFAFHIKIVNLKSDLIMCDLIAFYEKKQEVSWRRFYKR